FVCRGGVRQRRPRLAFAHDQGRHALRIRPMTQRGLLGAFGLCALALLAGSAARAHERATPLRICADPNNLPFSDSARRGFENRIASLVGNELGRPISYTWWAQR